MRPSTRTRRDVRHPDTTATRDLLAAARRDPAGGWGPILDRAESRLRILLHFRMPAALRATCEPDDLLQDTWLEASRLIDRFEYRGPGSLQRWLAGILENKLLHAERSSARIPRTDKDVGPAAAGASRLAAIFRTRASASREARRREREDLVRSVIESLPEELRRAVLLRVYEGLSGREAARVEGVDESTMSGRLRRALGACAFRLRGVSP